MEIASCPIPSGKITNKIVELLDKHNSYKINIGNNDKINEFENKMFKSLCKFFFTIFVKPILIIKGSMFIDLSKHLEWEHSQLAKEMRAFSLHSNQFALILFTFCFRKF